MSNDQFEIPKDQYVAFDAFSMKQHIKNRLNQGGVFTDQNFEGSNISTLIDIVAYTFNALMYYLNRTSTESMFSDSQIYENMNRIVKLLDYKPIGNQTSTLAFQASANASLPTGLHLIPRYSWVNANGVFYSLNEDVVVSKTTTGIEALTDLSNQKLLFQGRYLEYPVHTAQGKENETIYLLPGDNVIVDHFNIDVYVKDESGTWEQWSRTNSLYLENAQAKKYEVRYNDSKHYEIKFGNGINGTALKEGDLVAVYFLESDGTKGEVGVGAIRGKNFFKFNSSQFNGTNGILQDVVYDYNTTIISDGDIRNILLDNTSISTYFNDEETVDEIRQNAPGTFRSQYRVTTEGDFQNYIKTNFSQIIHDVRVVNNWDYVSQYLRYLYNLGLKNPNLDSRVLYNQVYFGDSCNFNNVYAFTVPKTIEDSITFAYLAPAQKELIMTDIKDQKVLTCELILMDPVYVLVGFGVPLDGISVAPSIANTSKLVVVKDESTRRNDTSIKRDVYNAFRDYFSRKNVSLGQVVDISDLTKRVLDIDGVKRFYTSNADGSSTYEGLSLVIWNPIYPNDVQLTTRNTPLPYFKLPSLFDANNFSNYIEVKGDQRIYETIEY